MRHHSRSAVTAPQRILIIRLSAIGDIVFASGMVPALKTRYPDAAIDWVVEESYRDLLQANPGVDKLHLWPRRRWGKLWRERQWPVLIGEMQALIRQLRARRYDWILDTQGLLKSGLFARLARGEFRVGLGSREGSQWWMARVVSRKTRDRRIASEYLQLLRELDVAPGDYPLDIHLSPEHQKEAEDTLRFFNINTPYAVFCPFTTRPQKHWRQARWPRLATSLQSRWGLSCLVLGSADEKQTAQEIVIQSQDACFSAAGLTSIGGSAALIRQATLVIGVDTGMTHLGIAFRRPTVALFGATRPYLDPVFDKARVLYRPRDCSPCRKRPICGGRFDCMEEWQVNDVIAAISQVNH